MQNTTLQRRRRTFRRFGAGALTTALLLGGAAAAQAVPTPDSGPIAGGTTVTIEAPIVQFTSVTMTESSVWAQASNGTFYGWGFNGAWIFGDGTTTDIATPTVSPTNMPAGVNFSQVIADEFISIALGNDGKTYAWGYNATGQVGDGTYLHRLYPVEVVLPTGVTFTQLNTLWESTVALGSDGNVYTWGLNQTGIFGDGTAGPGVTSNTPVQADAPPGVTFAQIGTGTGHTNGAISTTGDLYLWGASVPLGAGNGVGYSSVPLLLPAPLGVTFTQLALGAWRGAAIGNDGKIYTWGDYPGDGTTGAFTEDLFLADTPAGVSFSQVAAGNQHFAAIDDDGNLYTWGSNGAGQLGDGTYDDGLTPQLVAAPTGVKFVQVAAGSCSTSALGDDGNIYSWGCNGAGQLGDGTFDDNFGPVKAQPDVVVTGVTFDGLAGTGLVDNGDGTISVVTPAHPAGPVDVVLSWTLNGVTQTPITYTNGFTYYAPAPPTISNPADQTVADGDTAIFTVTTTGGPAPTVTWQVSTDGGVTWQAITADPAATPSPDGLTLTVVGAYAGGNNGYQYRATATNSTGSVASQPATLTVTQAGSTSGQVTTNIQTIPNLGGGTSMPLWAGLLPMLAGIGLIVAHSIAKRRAT